MDVKGFVACCVLLGFVAQPSAAQRCVAESGGWDWKMIDQADYPAGTDVLYYLACKVWRPMWSRCNGYCASTDTLTSTSAPFNRVRSCTCCRNERFQMVYPRPYCMVIMMGSDGTPTWQYEFVNTPLRQYAYILNAACACAVCNEPLNPQGITGNGRFKTAGMQSDSNIENDATRVDENQVPGRPIPPAATPEDEMRVMSEMIGGMI